MNSPAFTRAQKLRIRTMYMVNGLQPAEIARILGRETRQVQQLVSRNGWAAKRRENEDKAESGAIEDGLESAKAFVESVVSNSAEMAEKGFEMARDSIEPKDFADSMRGTKIAVDLVRQAMQLDAVNGPTAVTVNQFFGRPNQEKNVSPEPIQDASDVELEFA